MIEINLVPDIKQALIKAQRTRNTVITFAIFIGIGAIAVVCALAFYIYAVQTVRTVVVDTQIDEKSKKLAGTKDLSKILTIQNQLTKISALNGAKSIDSRIFDVLGAINPPVPNDVKMSVLTIDAKEKTITIDGQAANSYAAVEVFKKTIESANVKYYDAKNLKKQLTQSLASDISTTNTSYGEDALGAKVLRFTLSFVYTDKLFDPSSKNVSVSIPNRGNVTDSYLGVPFVERAKDLTGGQ